MFLAFGPIYLLFKFQVLRYPLCTVSAIVTSDFRMVSYRKSKKKPVKYQTTEQPATNIVAVLEITFFAKLVQVEISTFPPVKP